MQLELIYKTKTDVESKIMVTKGEMDWERDKLGV